MKITQNNMNKLIIPVLLLLAVVTGCVPDKSMTEQPITVTLNGQEVKEADIRLVNGQLHMSTSFIEQELGMRIQLTEEEEPGKKKSYYSNQVAVLMYHDLDDIPQEPQILPVSTFEKHMELLKTNDFHVISMEEYANFMQKGASIPDNAVLLTFDDGYVSFYTKAFPILRKYGYTATNFIIVSAVDNQTGRPKITWDQMREMKGYGMSFFSHTYDSHQYAEINAEGVESPMLSSPLYMKDKQRAESEDEYIQRITHDLSMAEQRLKKELGNAYGILAFPYGVYNKHVLAVLNKLDVKLSFTIKEGMTSLKDSIAYRFNAGSLKTTPEELIQLLKETSSEEENGKVSLDVKKPSLGKVWTDDSGKVMIPLREFCTLNGIRVDWNNDRKHLYLTQE
ncbi:polysaccharide deacetylase family protein [Paenibacillus motobuensis]|uniref:NodB homology domain-containing protein n=1 Tax=Paenibacillus motobuensis TaxID=295324 RepID=A0ABP3HY20_9BACL